MRILLPTCREVRERSFYQDFQRGVIEALEELGHHPLQFPFDAIGKVTEHEQQSLLTLLDRTEFGAILDLACWGFALSRLLTCREGSQREPIFDAFEVPYVGALFDHPFNQAINAILARDLHLRYPDLGHPSQVRIIFPQLRPTTEMFTPPAVRPGNRPPSGASVSARDIDVLYVGNLQPELLERFWNNPAHRLWKDAYHAPLCNALTDTICERPERSLHEGLETVLSGLDPPPTPVAVMESLRAIEGFARYRFRHDAVVALAAQGIRITVVGAGWETIGLPVNARLMPATDYDGLFRFARRAKLALDASTYLDGANDRVFSYGLSGAVCLTNAAGYLRAEGAAQNGVCFYSMNRLTEMVEQVRTLLSGPEALTEAGERARDRVLSAHTWRHRVPDLLAPVAGAVSRNPRAS